MGANEKHAATYHGREYTPTANDIREVWGGFSEYGGLVIRPSGTTTFLDDRYVEFDRWLETVRAEAKAEALREVASDLENASVSPIWCWDKCGDPMCRDDIRVDTATEIQSWIRDRADKQ